MKNIDTGKIKLSCYSQNVFKVIGSVSKARNLVHGKNLIKYILFHPLHYNLQYNFPFSFGKNQDAY